MNKPAFVTFTGVDRYTDVDKMLELQFRYPIEWGVLFSPDRQGKPDQMRYPDTSTLAKLWAAPRLNLSAHLCGRFAQNVFFGEVFDKQIDLKHFLSVCGRVQINTAAPLGEAELLTLRDFGVWHRLKVIVQCRKEFPRGMSPYINQVTWLFDASGGRGIEPKAWPQDLPNPARILRGYAGGLNPDNVAKHAATIGAHDTHFYLDMETGVRSTLTNTTSPGESSFFDLKKVEAVCRAVYGDAA